MRDGRSETNILYPHTTSLWGYNDITIKHSKGVKHHLFAMLDAKRKRSICCLTCHVVIVFREKSFKPIHVLLYSTIDHQPSEVLSDEVTKISSCCRNHITYSLAVIGAAAYFGTGRLGFKWSQYSFYVWEETNFYYGLYSWHIVQFNSLWCDDMNSVCKKVECCNACLIFCIHMPSAWSEVLKQSGFRYSTYSVFLAPRGYRWGLEAELIH